MSAKNPELINNGPDKIELVNCPHSCDNCKSIVTEINRLFSESEQYRNDKAYSFSVLSLKQAFEKSYELKEPVQQECAKLFRFTITESLENICRDLKSLTTGIFRRSCYKKCYNIARETLEKFKKGAPAGKERNLQDSFAPVADEETGT